MQWPYDYRHVAVDRPNPAWYEWHLVVTTCPLARGAGVYRVVRSSGYVGWRRVVTPKGLLSEDLSEPAEAYEDTKLWHMLPGGVACSPQHASLFVLDEEG